MTVQTTLGRIGRIFAVTAALWLLADSPDRAEAQALHCGTRQALVATLTGQFKESRQAIGLVSNRKLLELYVSGTGSWTILFTRPDGVACIGAAGSHWESVPLPTGQPMGPQTKAPADDAVRFSG